MKLKRIFKAFVAAGFFNVGQTFGFSTQKERDEFVEAIEGARKRGFVDVTPRQFREWQKNGYWEDVDLTTWEEMCSTGRLNIIKGGSLLRPGIDNEWKLERRDGKPETRWGYTPDPRDSLDVQEDSVDGLIAEAEGQKNGATSRNGGGVKAAPER